MNVTGVIHVGAHHGQEHARYLRAGARKIIYFEPVPKIFDILAENIKKTQEISDSMCETVLYNCALGNDNKSIEMFVESFDRYGCSSVLEPSSNYSHIPFSKSKNIQMRKLDDIVSDDVFNFLNIDVQGYELEVLKGSTRVLDNIEYIMCEINRETPKKKLDYKNASLVEEVCEFLSDYGFILVEENWAGVSWGDGFFIKQK